MTGTMLFFYSIWHIISPEFTSDKTLVIIICKKPLLFWLHPLAIKRLPQRNSEGVRMIQIKNDQTVLFIS